MVPKKSTLFPYTLQTVAVNMNELEFKNAQLSIFERNSKQFGLSHIKPIEWIIMAVTVALAIAGLIYVEGYSTILFWIMLVCVVVYLLVRTLGMKWYMKREFNKQISEIDMPEEMKSMKLGVQKHGLIMSMPAPKVNTKQKKGKGKRQVQMQVQQSSQRQAVIPWSAVTSWDETDDFMFIMFVLQGQNGSQIIPKRIKENNFPIDTVRNHLLEVKEQGLQTETA